MYQGNEAEENIGNFLYTVKVNNFGEEVSKSEEISSISNAFFICLMLAYTSAPSLTWDVSFLVSFFLREEVRERFVGSKHTFYTNFYLFFY